MKPFKINLRREGWKGHTHFIPNYFQDVDCDRLRILKISRQVIRPGMLACYSILFAAAIFLFGGCSIKKLAINSFADALTEGSAGVYASDDDPELIGQALPFALKTMESLLQSAPDNKQLLIAAASGFVQYAHAYVLRPAISQENSDLQASRAGRERAKRLFIRARNYGLRALATQYPNLPQTLNSDPASALSGVQRADIASLYWTGVAWGSAISVSKDDMNLVGELPIVQALLNRALELDESWQDGAIHEFFIVFEAGRSEAEGGGVAKAEQHFKRAMALNQGHSISPLVAFAESVCVKQQARKRFRELLTQALNFDVDGFSQNRLSNILAQRKAAELLKNIDLLFYVDEDESFDPNAISNE
ncbi:MAG: TRAP transporter TatT component family protein [bacterium]